VKGERRKEKGERRKEKGERRKAKGESKEWKQLRRSKIFVEKDENNTISDTKRVYPDIQE
jgi:hypothetical protein